MGSFITILLAAGIFGYGGYQLYKTVKAGSQGKCAGCSFECDVEKKENCSENSFKQIGIKSK